ncbi:GNAT family N-acetyltransferase [Salmonella enterica subsp. enterica]|nr:GNAT family N-acetyltransferase [Salmonella enterica subsp. enterica serovar Enteritidis]
MPGGFANLIRRREYGVEDMEERHSGDVAVLHREDFVRPWSEDEFSALIVDRAVFGYIVREVGNPAALPVGFVLARQAAGEAEILTVAVARSHRRGGLGWKLMDAVLRRLHADRAEALFLEVDERNAGAIALYRRLGFHQVGVRPAYYETSDASGRSSALVMRRDLR